MELFDLLVQQVRGLTEVVQAMQQQLQQRRGDGDVLGKGDAASVLFFGAFVVTALAGMPSIDAKVARRDPEGWARLAAVTSIVPFGAVADGRNRWVPGEIGWLAPALGAALWGMLLYWHPRLFGVAPVPLG